MQERRRSLNKKGRPARENSEAVSEGEKNLTKYCTCRRGKFTLQSSQGRWERTRRTCFEDRRRDVWNLLNGSPDRREVGKGTVVSFG